MIIYIKVRPNSEKKEILKKSDNSYLIYIKEKAENNKANIELIKLLQRYFKGKNIIIKSGFKSKNKIVEIKDE